MLLRHTDRPTINSLKPPVTPPRGAVNRTFLPINRTYAGQFYATIRDSVRSESPRLLVNEHNLKRAGPSSRIFDVVEPFNRNFYRLSNVRFFFRGVRNEELSIDDETTRF